MSNFRLETKSKTVHKIKTYKITYDPEQSDYFFQAPEGTILSVQTSKGNSGRSIYITILHDSKYTEGITYHVKTVLDGQNTYIHKFEFIGRIYLNCTPAQKEALDENIEKSYIHMVPVNIFIKGSGSTYPTA